MVEDQHLGAGLVFGRAGARAVAADREDVVAVIETSRTQADRVVLLGVDNAANIDAGERRGTFKVVRARIARRSLARSRQAGNWIGLDALELADERRLANGRNTRSGIAV